jgi:hypothetical protein
MSSIGTGVWLGGAVRFLHEASMIVVAVVHCIQFIHAVFLQYDLSATTFSPDGRVFQVEYASKAVENSGYARVITRLSRFDVPPVRAAKGIVLLDIDS